MDKVQQFRKRAVECRSLAMQGTTAEIKGHYQQLANMWDKLAEERLAFFISHGNGRLPQSGASSR
jgi:hypothetical protein